ncbi:aldolase [Sphingomonas koreensis]|nr:aldolase [Sphingomonas koreensis]
MTAVSSETLHASCVAIGGRAVLIEGRSGSGKSDLALRLIDRGATLVSDDYTVLVRDKGQLVAIAPANIAGQIEVRGLGIVPIDHVERVPVALVITLTDLVERFPDERPERTVAGVSLLEIALNPFEMTAPIKVELALARLTG